MPSLTPLRAPWVACLALCLASARPARLSAQGGVTPVTRAGAVEMAVGRGARLGIALADTAAAAAALVTARALPDPSLAASYTKSVPRYHAELELPLDYPWIRGARVGAALAARRSAAWRFRLERAAAALDADTTYTRALASRAHAELSRRNAVAADSLRRMVALRRDAGDASDLDVELATVDAGREANAAAADSLDYLSTLLDLQVLLGLTSDDVAITLADSLGAPPSLPGDAGAPARGAAPARQAPGSPLAVAAAEASLEAATLGLRAQRRALWPAPSIAAGFETGDPSGGEPGILPTVGFTLPLPLFSRNRGPILEARAGEARARAELALARAESRAAIARARRSSELAVARLARDRALVASAERVAAMSRTAYREGASSLPDVLLAQRDARDVVAQYVDDLAAAWIATATLRVVTMTSATP